MSLYPEPESTHPKTGGVRKGIDFQTYLEEFELNLETEQLLEENSYSMRSDLVPVSWNEINSREYEEQAWRIKGLIPKSGSTILASISGERKTWVALEMAKCISQGTNFLDSEQFSVEGCNVLFLNAENAWNEIQRRGRQLGFTNKSSNALHILNTDDVNLGSEKGKNWLKACIEYHDIGIVFVDTFRAVAGALREEKAEEIRQFFSRFNSLKNSGISVVWLDHCRKPSNFDGKQPKKEHLLGSQDKTASVEVLLMIRSEPGAEGIDVYQRKNRLAVELPPFRILMKDSEEAEGKRTILSYGGELEEQESKKEEAKELILTILESGEQTTKQILEQTRKQVGSKNTRGALADLVQEGLVAVSKQSRENLYALIRELENLEYEPTGVPSKENSNLFDST